MYTRTQPYIQTFQVDMLPSLNDYAHYQRIRRSQKLRNDTWNLVKFQKIQPIRAYPIDVEIQGFFRNVGYDTTNLAGPWKIIEDVLVQGRILVGDQSKFVRQLLYHAAGKSNLKYDYVQIKLIEHSPGFILADPLLA